MLFSAACTADLISQIRLDGHKARDEYVLVCIGFAETRADVSLSEVYFRMGKAEGSITFLFKELKCRFCIQLQLSSGPSKLMGKQVLINIEQN